MKTFQRYLSSIKKGSIREVLDLPAAVLDHVLAKFFKMSENGWLRLWTWPCRVCSEVYTEAGPKAGPLSLSFYHLKGNWWNQSSKAVNINKFSCCNTSQFKHLQGPSDLNSRAVFFFPVWRFAASLSTSSRYLNRQVVIIQEARERLRVFIESDDEEQYWFCLNCIFFYRHGRTAFEQKFEALFCRNWRLAVDSWECRWKFSRHIVTQLY